MAVSDPAAARDLLSRQLHFVSGKGGVGKSVVACALAHRFVAQGHKTLLCQVHARDTHAALLGTPPIGDEVHQVEPGLWVVNMSPAAALREYALLVLKFDTVVKAVFDNRVSQAFLRFVPGLPELNMLGKVWFHAEETTEGGRPRFDRIVVDAPSTGHGLGFLRVARVMTELTGGRGPMAEKTRLMQEVIHSPERSALHVVTLPEEMPANEALEFIAHARGEDTAPLGMCVVNMVTPRLFEDDDRPPLDRLAGLDSPEAAALHEVADRRLAREELEELHLGRLAPDQTGLVRATIPLLPVAHFGRRQVRTVAEELS